MPTLELNSPLRFVKGCGPKLGEALGRVGIMTVQDLVERFPFRYERITSVANLSGISSEGGRVSLLAHLDHVRMVPLRSRPPILEVWLKVGDDMLVAKFFNYKHMGFVHGLPADTVMLFKGEVKGAGFRRFDSIHPELKSVQENDKAAQSKDQIVPIYSDILRIPGATIGKLVRSAMTDLPKLAAIIPESLTANLHLLSHDEALRSIHFPAVDLNIEDLNEGKSRAHKTLIFEEFYLFQKKLKELRASRKKIAVSPWLKAKAQGEITIPFKLTSAQERVLKEIQEDFRGGSQTQRLIQGDVGSGKTIVALLASAAALDNGYDVVFMAPTEILAEQHFRNAQKILGGYQVSICTQSQGSKKDLLEGLIVGTHALFQSSVKIKNLGLVIIDEQHRFGVEQRQALSSKGVSPHILAMSATPIPRSLAMTAYGDLDLSIIDELPPGRSPVETKHVFLKDFVSVEKAVERAVKEGEPVFVVYPLTQESQFVDLQDAESGLEKWKKRFPKARIELLHGKMKNDEKEAIVKRLRAGKIDILIATTIIEVGIDVPEATLMVIMHGERYGLSQLHQLRGRVGRGGKPGECWLVTPKTLGDTALERMKAMVKTRDGFELADLDLKQRGPGDILGVRQSGIPLFRFGNIIRDQKIMERARVEASLDS